MFVDAEQRRQELLNANEQDGPVFKIQNDPRITPVGRFLRKTSVDELPQLWNVLKGDMSLVGPRPPIYEEVLEDEVWQRHRLEVTPGLTCIWQVRGRSRVSFREWMRMDQRYIRSRSWLLDLKLLFLTVPAVILRRGAS
jgi:lipopolysaccharide/colanic/teichoic acid biosynthesis glycosyltransferase